MNQTKTTRPMTQPRTFLFVLELGPMQVGVAYERLALHCTLMHRFKTSLTAQEVWDHTASIFAGTHPLILTAGLEDHFGPSDGPKNIIVNRIEKSPELAGLHMKLYECLNEVGVQHTEPDYSGLGYTPHVSMQGDQRLHEGEQRSISAIYLVEILDHTLSAHKLVHARIPLGA